MQKALISKSVITPGTENSAEIVRVNQFTQIEIGTNCDKALTAQIAPTPPKTLVNRALKKLLLLLKINIAIKINTPAKIYTLVILSPIKYIPLKAEILLLYLCENKHRIIIITLRKVVLWTNTRILMSNIALL